MLLPDYPDGHTSRLKMRQHQFLIAQMRFVRIDDSMALYEIDACKSQAIKQNS